MSKSKFIPILIVSLTLGLGWAIRGSFGHEWGASWAGAMGALALVVVAGKKHWLKNIPVLAALGAIGWAVGGMSSYGVVIGYCRSTDFMNVLYGYVMLAVIGGIYGYIGGGFLGLGLETDKNKKPDWANLIAQMVAGGMLVWGFIIYQLEWFMTPPRSELWAAAFGGCAALGWYMWRENFKKSFRIAAFTGLGAGFGFSFGNFIQVIGASSGISYNWWNVMEFTLGFLGGLAMAYAIFTTKWEEEIEFSPKSNLFALIFLFVIIPYINFDQQFDREYFTKFSEIQKSLNAIDFASLQINFGWITLIAFSVFSIFIWHRLSGKNSESDKRLAANLFFANSLFYTVFLIFRNGLFYTGFELGNSNTLYVPILLIIFAIYYFSKEKEVQFTNYLEDQGFWSNWKYIAVIFIVALVVITLISINLHEGLPGSHLRFK
ncbi:MAG: hypothetical protein KDC88_04725 [Ignavibacteriae bacterium]|nr:hypothetical protein [Ignavibacteriota bacterium]